MSGDGPKQGSEFNYIRRGGRMTKAQQRGFNDRLASFAVGLNDLAELPDDTRPLGMEIGFGMGQALLDWAQQASAWQLLGVELYRPGVGALADNLDKLDIRNVAIIEEPAERVVAALPAGCVSEVRIFFPDPWPKKRHAKRRIIQVEFIQALRRCLAEEGVLRMATDWTPYAEWMREIMAAAKGYELKLDQVRAHDEGSAMDRSTTKFERRGEGLGHDIHDLIYIAR